jgi:hypothetical protein
MAELVLDPNVRDFLFVPLIILLFLLGSLKNYVMKVYSPANPLVSKKRKEISFSKLKLEEKEKEDLFNSLIAKVVDQEHTYEYSRK